MRRFLIAALLLTAATPLVAQPDYRGQPRSFRSEIQIQVFRFDNFFQARGGAPEVDMNAAGFEYGVAYRQEENGPDLFGALYAINYARQGTETSFGGRIGMSRFGSVHSFYVYLDRLQNGYAFDIEETTANADITALYGLYTYRIVPDWQVGLSTYNDWTSFDVETGFEGRYNQLEAEVRYRGFGRIFEPRIGYAVGDRDVENNTDSFSHRHWFVQVSTRPVERLDLSLRYRHRTRDYKNLEREEDRGQVQLRALFRHTDRLASVATFTRENVNSSLPGRDFSTGRLFAGLTVGF
ncbi:MAG TPA: hypothetical protein VMS98_16715 [Thermoanaerobaculia bacterium]|nr:hypothetical protein [Thermoanaerobaculia bacterium]